MSILPSFPIFFLYFILQPNPYHAAHFHLEVMCKVHINAILTCIVPTEVNMKNGTTEHSQKPVPALPYPSKIIFYSVLQNCDF